MESHAIKSNIYNKSKPITISLPTNKFDKVGIRRSMMPNLIHSLDASNIHMLIKHLDEGTSIYTIHDCFASLPNSMKKVENKVKETFIEIYFKDGNYVKTLNEQLLTQISSLTDILTDDDGKDYIIIKTIDKKGVQLEEKVEVPKLPEAFTSNVLLNEFIKGLDRSRAFIS